MMCGMISTLGNFVKDLGAVALVVGGSAALVFVLALGLQYIGAAFGVVLALVIGVGIVAAAYKR